MLTLIASYLRYWPFGFVRTNFYLLPLLMLIAGVGGVRTWGYGVSMSDMHRNPLSPRMPPDRRRRAKSPACPRRWHRLVRLGGGGVVIVAIDDVGAYRQLRGSTAAPQFGADIGKAVAAVQRHAQPHAAVLVAGGGIGAPGWRYYEFEYGGKAAQAGRRLAPSQVDFFERRFHGHDQVRGLKKPTEVFLYEPVGSTAWS